MFSCEICEIFKNTYFEENLGSTASKHRSSFLQVFCRSCCSALINAVMKYSLSAAKLESVTCKFIKNCTPSQVFFKEFATSAEQRCWKMHLDACFWRRIYFGNIPAWLLFKGSCKDIFILEILKPRLHSFIN